MNKLLLPLFLFSNTVMAQTTSDWLQQKKMQKKYLLEQIAALKIYRGHVRKGYAIVSKGWNNIQSIKNGDLALHKMFFDGLRKVNPAIQRSAKVAGMIHLHQQIINKIGQCKKAIAGEQQLTRDEIVQSNQTFNNLLEDCQHSTDELVMLTTSNKIVMGDSERLQRIDNLYREMQDKQAFLSEYAQQIQLLIIQRKHDQFEVNLSKQLQ